jgi:DNA repair protein RecO (recombination protein O)
MLTKDQAICIRTVDYSETSQVVTFFTKATGKISAIAKGSKRPKSAFGGPIEILSHGRIVFSDPNREKLATLTEFEPAGGTPGLAPHGTWGLLRNDLFALNCCLFAAELLNLLTDEHDPHPGLFDSFLQFLHDAQDAGDKSETLALLILFQLALLKEVGLQPILSHCANCKTSIEYRVSSIEYRALSIEHRVYFSSSANGLICRDCEPAFQDKFKLSRDAATCLANLKLLAESPQKTLLEVEKLLAHHFTELTGHRPKMAKHVLKT